MYLQRADEIKIPWTQREKISHYIDLYPNAVIIVQHLFSGKPIDWHECERIFNENDGSLVLCLGNVRDCLTAYEKDIPFYYGFPILSYDELNSIAQFDAPMARVMVPDCVYRGFCPFGSESCGFVRSQDYKEWRNDYISNVEIL